MATKYTRVSQNKWEGVYFYESTTKKHDSKPDMCYVVSFKVGDRKIWEKVGWKSQGISPQVAHQYRIKRIQEIHLGTPLVTATQRKLDMQKRNRTIGEIADIYFDSKGSNLKGLKTDKNRYEKHVDPLFGKSRVPDLTPIDIDTLKQSMGEKADGTIWNAIEILRRIINFGAKNNLCPALSFTIEMPKRDNERVEYLKEDEMQRLYAVMKNWQNQEVCRMLKLE